MPTAHKLGVKRLYHYSPYKEPYLKTTLLARSIHYSDPKAFNDPWDSRPWFDTSDLSDS